MLLSHDNARMTRPRGPIGPRSGAVCRCVRYNRYASSAARVLPTQRTIAMISEEQLQDWRARAMRVEEEVSKAIIGQADTVRLINVALFARGHVLLEGDVGVGKTTVLRAFARVVGGDFERVEGTVDLMPG